MRYGFGASAAQVNLQHFSTITLCIPSQLPSFLSLNVSSILLSIFMQGCDTQNLRSLPRPVPLVHPFNKNYVMEKSLLRFSKQAFLEYLTASFDTNSPLSTVLLARYLHVTRYLLLDSQCHETRRYISCALSSLRSTSLALFPLLDIYISFLGTYNKVQVKVSYGKLLLP